jgi:hypothetical protein
VGLRCAAVRRNIPGTQGEAAATAAAAAGIAAEQQLQNKLFQTLSPLWMASQHLWAVC